jgi:hypothetical protein
MGIYLIGAATSARLDGNSLPLIVDEAAEFQGAYGCYWGKWLPRAS